MPINVLCPRCKMRNEVPNDRAGGTVACEYCLALVAVPGLPASAKLPATPSADFTDVQAQLELAKAELAARARRTPPQLVDRGPPPVKIRPRRLRTSFEDDVAAVGRDGEGGVLDALAGAAMGAAAAAEASEDSDFVWALALGGIVGAAASFDYGFADKDRPLQPDSDNLVAFRRFVQGRRIDRYGDAVIALRSEGADLTPLELRDLKTAVRLATHFVCCLLDDARADSRAAWLELVRRFELEPGADVVHDLLVETDLVPTLSLNWALRRWWHVAVATKHIPEDMIPADQRRHTKKRPRRPHRSD